VQYGFSGHMQRIFKYGDVQNTILVQQGRWLKIFLLTYLGLLTALLRIYRNGVVPAKACTANGLSRTARLVYQQRDEWHYSNYAPAIGNGRTHIAVIVHAYVVDLVFLAGQFFTRLSLIRPALVCTQTVIDTLYRLLRLHCAAPRPDFVYVKRGGKGKAVNCQDNSLFSWDRSHRLEQILTC